MEPRDSQRTAAAGAGFNLAAALVNLANPAGIITGYTRDLLRWLERSGVDETRFEDCMKRAQCLAYPNKNGMVLSASVARADERLQKIKMGQMPLAIVFSQALGRYIIRDPDLSYMASTTACLLTHHDLSYAKSALTSMILDKGGHETETKYNYEVWRTPFRAVISSVVESIFLNISNPGHQTADFPPELANLHAHLLDDTNFAAIVMQVQTTSTDLVLQADRFPADIVLWLLNHFEGHFELYVKSAKVLDAKLGLHTRRITTIVQETCSEDHEACDGRSWPVVLAEIVDGEPCRLVGGSSSKDLKPRSHQRQKLYITDDLINTTYTSDKVHLGREERNEIKHAARRITQWLMHVPINVKDWPQLVNFCFKSELELDEDRDRSLDFDIGRLLSRSPRILQERTGESTRSSPIFRRPPWHGSPISSQNTDPEQWGSETTPEEVLKNFPCAEQLLENMQKSCRCPNCRSEGSLSRSKRGCLRYSAVLELCILVSHAVADALGAEDVSGAPDPEDAKAGVMTLLSEVIDQEIVQWDTWFGVAACAVTGCSWDLFTKNKGISGDEGGSSWVGVQYGSLAVLAPWLDFRAPLKIDGSFKILYIEGSVEGVKDDKSLIQTEHAPADPPGLSDPIDMGASSSRTYEKLASTDDTPFQVQKALFRVERSLHKLLVIVRVSNHLRLVDPTRSMVNLSRSQQAGCCHRRSIPTPRQLEEILESNLKIRAFTFQDIFAQWGGTPNRSFENDHDKSCDMTPVIGDLRKLHIALAISNGGVILRNSQCCLPCALRSHHDSRIEPEYHRPILSFDILGPRQLEGLATNHVQHLSDAILS